MKSLFTKRKNKIERLKDGGEHKSYYYLIVKASIFFGTTEQKQLTNVRKLQMTSNVTSYLFLGSIPFNIYNFFLTKNAIDYI